MYPHRGQSPFATYLALSIALLLFGLFWLIQPAPQSYAQSQPEALGSIRGVVRNDGGQPLPNIVVILEALYGDLRRVTTNAQGEYEFLSLPSGTYRLRTEDPAKVYETEYYADAIFPIDATNVVVNGNNIGGIDISLSAAGSISLTLESTLPISQLYYSALLYRPTANGTWTLFHEWSGEFGENTVRFDGLPTGIYRLCARASDYYYGNYLLVECYDNARPGGDYQLAAGATDIAVKAGEETTLLMTLGDIPQIQGYILNRQGAPLADILVALFSTEASYPQLVAQTDSSGYYSFPFVPNGTYIVVYNAASELSYGYTAANRYLPLYYPDEILPSRAVPLTVDETTRISETKRLRPSAQIIGKVTLLDDVPVSWANINLFRKLSDGSFSNPYCVDRCYKSYYDANTGVYTVTNLLGGTFRVSADAYVNGANAYLLSYYGSDNFETATEVTVPSGQQVSGIDITVGDRVFDGFIRGMVTANGVPQEGIEVGLFDAFFFPSYESFLPRFTTTTDAQGRYSLEGLSSGYYYVGFRDPKGVYATTFYSETSPFQPLGIPLFESQVAENINVDLKPGATIRGHIRTLNDQQPSDFVMKVVSRSVSYGFDIALPYIDVRSAADGSYEITGLPPGTYYLYATSPSNSGTIPFPVWGAYPGGFDNEEPIVLQEGQTVEGKDIFFFVNPSNYLPIITGGLATPTPEPTPYPTWQPDPPLPDPEPPFPTPTPDF